MYPKDHNYSFIISLFNNYYHIESHPQPKPLVQYPFWTSFVQKAKQTTSKIQNIYHNVRPSYNNGVKYTDGHCGLSKFWI
ncbi:hypothetical protein Hanom_Chr11g01057531 [Helianthus anomalus]